MFEFGMETKRICDLLKFDANSRMSDLEFLNKEVNLWLKSRERMEQITGDAYYDYDHDIKNKTRTVIVEDGQMAQDTQLPNNKMMDNQYAKAVDQKVNYMLSKPITFKTANDAYNELLGTIFNKRFQRLIKNIGKDSYNGGFGYLYPYYDENGEFKFKRFRPWEIKVYWKDDDKTEIDCFFHYYEMQGYEGQLEKVYRFVEVYDTNGIHKFEYINGGLKPDYSTYHFEQDVDDQIIEYNWNRVPLIAFKANSNCVPLIRKCKALQDAINEILSQFKDGMDENAGGNSIIVIKNYDGENLGTFRRNLSTYKAVKVRTVDGADGGVEKLEITVNCENYKLILAELKKALIQNCKAYDSDELKSAGSPNEMTIKSIFSDIDLDANELETEYQASFEDLMWFVNQHFQMIGAGDFSNEQVEIIFNRDMMINDSQIIADLNNSASILSHKTLVSLHPWVNDVEAELKEQEDEEKKNLDKYGDLMNSSQNQPPKFDSEDD